MVRFSPSRSSHCLPSAQRQPPELGVHGISQGTHDGREDGAADQAHEHQAGNLVLALRTVHQGAGEEEREHVGVTEADQSHSHPEQGDRWVGSDRAEDGEAYGGGGHDDAAHQNADAVGDHREHDTAGESADHTGDEVDHGGGGGDFGEGVAGVFGEDARGLGVDADVHAHVGYDAEEAQEHDAVGEQELEAAADFVHQHAGGHGEDQEPEEHHGGEQVCGAVGQIELSLDVVRGGADQIDEAQDEDANIIGAIFTRPALPVLVVSLLILNSLFLYCNETMNC